MSRNFKGDTSTNTVAEFGDEMIVRLVFVQFCFAWGSFEHLLEVLVDIAISHINALQFRTRRKKNEGRYVVTWIPHT